MCDELTEKVHTFIVVIMLRPELGEGGGWRERGRAGVLFKINCQNDCEQMLSFPVT